MKHFFHFFIVLLLFSYCTNQQQTTPAAAAESKVQITASMVTQNSPGDKTADKLFDGNVSTPWFPGWSSENYPQVCVIDFGKAIKPSKIRFYDGAGTPRLSMIGANDLIKPYENYVFAFEQNLDKYNQWVERPLSPSQTPFRYLIVRIMQSQGYNQLTELEVYTTGQAPNPPPDTTVTNPPVPPIPPVPSATVGISEKINLSGFHWVPLDKLQPFKFIRIYVASNWVWQPKGLYVEPMFQAGSPAVPGFDTYLTRAKAQGLTVMPAINQTPAWYRQGWFSGALSAAQMSGTPQEYSSKLSLRMHAINGKAQSARAAAGDLGDDYPPVKPGMDRTNPASYKDFAEFWGQFVMRYGSVVHPIIKLKVDQTPRWQNDIPNQAKTGLDLIKYVEVWNEPDKWWKRGGAEDGIYMKPQEYAAMLSACYDAIKAADPSVKVVMSGITGFDLAYLKSMDDWFRSKGMPFKADIVNVHHYSNRGNALGQWPPTWYEAGAVCPEMDKDFIGIVPIVDWAKSKGKPVWVTEFGSDTRPPSWMFAPPVAGFSSEDLQAQWLVRGYLEYIRLGVDNMFMFNAINEPGATNGGLYLNSGLMYGANEPNPYGPKKSYTAVTGLIASLNDCTYHGDISTAGTRAMMFRHKSGQIKVVYWSPTMSGTTSLFNFGNCPLTATEWPQIINIQ